MNIKEIIVFCSVMMSISFLNAQEVPDTIIVDAPSEIPALPGDEVEVVKDFQARLAETQMIRILPELPVHQTSTIPFSYEVNVRGLALDYLPPKIRPTSLPTDPEEKSYNGFLQFAYGYPHFSQGKAFVDYKISNKLDVGLKYDHVALKHNERIPAGMYRHSGLLYGKYTLNSNIEVGADVTLDFRERDLRNRLFGENIDQNRNLYGGIISLSSPLNINRTLFYDLRFGYNRLDIMNEFAVVNEGDIILDGFVKKRFGLFGLSFAADLDVLRLEADHVSSEDLVLDLTSINLSPRLLYNDDFWNITAGLDLLSENAVFKYLPQVEIKRMILGSKLHAGLFVKTDVVLNSLNRLTEVNPYVYAPDTLLNEKTIKYGAVLEGSFDRIEYGVELGYKQSNDLIEYRREFPTDFHRLLQYGTRHVNANSVFIDGVLSYNVNKNFTLKTDISYQNYRDSLSNDILGLPDLNIGLTGEMSFVNDKLHVQPNVRFINNISLITENEIGRVFDLGLSADYRISKNFSVYMKSNNLLNKDYQRWDWYPNQGIAIAGGLTVRF